MVPSPTIVPRPLTRRGVIAAAMMTALAARSRRISARAQATSTPTSAAPHAAIWPKLNLNSASEEQFLGIPGTGEKLAHEFEEYRPYTSIGQYRGEIGKYVAPEEVAALERYLFVPVDPNTADADTMVQLPGMTPELVASLEAQRPFASHQAFLTALQSQVAPELSAAIAAYLSEA